MSAKRASIDMDPCSDHDPDLYATVEAERQHAAAVERVREYLVTRDGFYGREAGDDDVLDSAYVGSGYEGTVPLLLSDLRTLVAALAELDEIRHRLCSALMHSRDGRVGNPLVARAMVGDAMPWETA